MATKKKARATKRKTGRDGVPQVKVNLKPSADKPALYGNYVCVARSHFDFELTCWPIPSIAVQPGTTSTVVERSGEHIATVLLPHEVARGLIAALRTTWHGFVNEETQALGSAYRKWEGQAFKEEDK